MSTLVEPPVAEGLDALVDLTDVDLDGLLDGGLDEGEELGSPDADLDVAATLAVMECHTSLRAQAEARVFTLAAHYADLANADTLPADGGRRGRQRPVRLGGSGTPTVAEFAVAELAVRLGVSTFAARSLLADALDVRHRLPRLWTGVRTGLVRVPLARLTAAKTRHLDRAAARRVDAAVAGYADGRLGYGRFLALVEAKVVAADPQTAEEAARAAEAAQFARATRSTRAGIRGFYLRARAGLVARFDATVGYLADGLARLGDTDPEDLRRVKACLLMANPTLAVELLAALKNLPGTAGPTPPGNDAAHDDHPDAHEVGDRPAEPEGPVPEDPQEPAQWFDPSRIPDWMTGHPQFNHHARFDWARLLPVVRVWLHTHEDSQLVRSEHGPMTRRWVRDQLAPYQRFTITPVIDLANQAPVDAYEIPERHRQAVHLMTPADCFPYSPHLSTRPHDDQVDIDHTRAHPRGRDQRGTEPEKPEQAGQSAVGNYGPLRRYEHRVKTHAPWQVRQPFPGIYLRRDPHGLLYLVDHTGTRKL